jgi:hypothetical protein
VKVADQQITGLSVHVLSPWFSDACPRSLSVRSARSRNLGRLFSARRHPCCRCSCLPYRYTSSQDFTTVIVFNQRLSIARTLRTKLIQPFHRAKIRLIARLEDTDCVAAREGRLGSTGCRAGETADRQLEYDTRHRLTYQADGRIFQSWLANVDGWPSSYDPLASPPPCLYGR